MSIHRPPSYRSAAKAKTFVIGWLACSAIAMLCGPLNARAQSEPIYRSEKHSNQTGESTTIEEIVRVLPAPARVMQYQSSIGGTINEYAVLGDSYRVRWLVNSRDLYVIDDLPLGRLIPTEASRAAREGGGRAIVTRFVFLPDARLRVEWSPCEDRSCSETIRRGYRYQHSHEFQGRLEASARFPVE